MRIPLNTVRITLASFLAYFVMSSMATPLGIISQPIANFYEISITTATSSFSYLTVGVLIGTLIAIFIFDYIKFKTLIITSCLTLGACVYAMYAVNSFVLLSLWLGLVGTCCGLLLSSAAVVITETYSEKMRAPMLLLTDSFYSMAGVCSSYLAAAFITQKMHFSSAYLLAFGVAVIIALLAAFSRYSINTKNSEGNMPQRGITQQPVSAHLVSAAIFLYLLGFVGIYSWIPNYAQNVLGADVESSGRLVGRLFFGMFIGQLVTFFVVLKVPTKHVLIFCTAAASLLTIALWNVSTVEALSTTMLVLGLVGGGLFKVLIADTSSSIENSGPKLVTYLIFSSAFGTAVSPAISSFIVEYSDIAGALQFTTLCYALMFLLFTTSLIVRPRISVRQA